MWPARMLRWLAADADVACSCDACVAASPPAGSAAGRPRSRGPPAAVPWLVAGLAACPAAAGRGCWAPALVPVALLLSSDGGQPPAALGSTAAGGAVSGVLGAAPPLVGSPGAHAAAA